MKFTDALDEYLELRERGPDESSGYTDKAYYIRCEELRNAMNDAVGALDRVAANATASCRSEIHVCDIEAAQVKDLFA